jgi:polyisoprenoid-binding protein YceI
VSIGSISREELAMTEAAAPSAASRQVGGRTVPVAGTWAVDPAHSSFEFVARHMMAKVRGRFTDFTANVVIAEDPEQSSAEVELDVNSVTTRDERRDGHLRSPDFFDVEKYPKITFRSTALRPGKDDNTWELDGDLTILGVTRPVTWNLEFHGASQDPWGGQRAAFSAETEVNREDWGLTWNAPLETGGFLLSRNAKLEVDVELMKQ